MNRHLLLTIWVTAEVMDGAEAQVEDRLHTETASAAHQCAFVSILRSLRSSQTRMTGSWHRQIWQASTAIWAQICRALHIIHITQAY